MFTVVGDTIYYDGREFATITATPYGNGGWVGEARDTIDSLTGGFTPDEIGKFVEAFEKQIVDRVGDAVEKAQETLWLHDLQAEKLCEALVPVVNRTLFDTFEEATDYQVQISDQP